MLHHWPVPKENTTMADKQSSDSQQKASKEAQANKTVSQQPEARTIHPAAENIDPDTGLLIKNSQVNDPPAGQAPTPTQARSMTSMRVERGDPLPGDIEGKFLYL